MSRLHFNLIWLKKRNIAQSFSVRLYKIVVQLIDSICRAQFFLKGLVSLLNFQAFRIEKFT